MSAKELLSKLTLEEKIALCEGLDFWHTMPYESHDIPSVMMCDGPHGLRKQVDATDMVGVNESVPATCFPTAVTTGCSWDPELLGEIGQAICEEARAEGVSLVLGPGLNIKRNPLCGRNFEYFSEDPLLAGKLAAGFVRGGQSTGVGCCLKHFAANSQEYKRFSSDSIMDERTLREIYLRGFEIAVKESDPSTVMCSYNKINGIHTGDDSRLLTDILRKEWGFNGFVVTDWGAMNDRIKGFQAGCDLSMPGGSKYGQKKALKAVKEGTLSEEDVDRCALRILEFVLKAQKTEMATYDKEKHHSLARKAAAESAVLLKNEGALPVRGTACLIGSMAKSMRYQGAGSSHIAPTKLTHPADCLEWPYAQGCNEDGMTTDSLLEEAVKLAKTVETPVVFAGLTDTYESEGFDRENMKMPQGHIQMIEAVAKANPNTVVVLFCGSAVEVPWLDQVNALLYMALPGQAGGEAVADILTGKVNPGGKLAETWPLCYEDAVTHDFYERKDAEYREAVFVGYRYYDSAHKKVCFPFGYGLSYTSFDYSDLKAERNTVTVTVKNTGAVEGAEVVQVYICPQEKGIYRPERTLAAFQKIYLKPGEEKQVILTLDEHAFDIWNDGWKTVEGMYSVEVNRLSVKLKVEGNSIPMPDWQKGSWYETLSGVPSKGEWEKLMGHPVNHEVQTKGTYTMDNTVMEMKETSWVMKKVYGIVEDQVAKGFGGKKDYTDPTFRMLINSSVDCPLRSMAIFSNKDESFFEGLLDMANGHFFQGVGKMLKK